MFLLDFPTTFLFIALFFLHASFLFFFFSFFFFNSSHTSQIKRGRSKATDCGKFARPRNDSFPSSNLRMTDQVRGRRRTSVKPLRGLLSLRAKTHHLSYLRILFVFSFPSFRSPSERQAIVQSPFLSSFSKFLYFCYIRYTFATKRITTS